MSNTETSSESVVKNVNPVPEQDKPADHDNGPKDRMEVVVKLVPCPNCNDESAKKTKDPYKWLKIILTAMWATVPIFISIYAAVISTGSQSASWESARNSGRSADVAGKTADAAQKNVATAQDALKATIENSRLDQRAWVGVVKLISPELKVGGETVFGITLVNSGKTPARKALSNVVVRLVRAGELLTISYSSPPLRRSITLLSPQIPISIYNPDVERTFIETEVEDIKNKRMIVYLFGKVSYEDVSHQAHCRTFCYWLSPDLKLGYACEMYNEETDTQCPD